MGAHRRRSRPPRGSWRPRPGRRGPPSERARGGPPWRMASSTAVSPRRWRATSASGRPRPASRRPRPPSGRCTPACSPRSGPAARSPTAGRATGTGAAPERHARRPAGLGDRRLRADPRRAPGAARASWRPPAPTSPGPGSCSAPRWRKPTSRASSRTSNSASWRTRPGRGNPPPAHPSALRAGAGLDCRCPAAGGAAQGNPRPGAGGGGAGRRARLCPRRLSRAPAGPIARRCRGRCSRTRRRCPPPACPSDLLLAAPGSRGGTGTPGGPGRPAGRGDRRPAPPVPDLGIRRHRLRVAPRRWWAASPPRWWPRSSTAGSAARKCAKRRAELEGAVAAFGDLFLGALRDVESALVNERQQTERLARQQTQLETAKRLLSETRNRYSQGLTDYLPVLAALTTVQRLERRDRDDPPQPHQPTHRPPPRPRRPDGLSPAAPSR